MYCLMACMFFCQSTCLAQSEQIRRLQEQLAFAEKKLQVVDLALRFLFIQVSLLRIELGYYLIQS